MGAVGTAVRKQIKNVSGEKCILAWSIRLDSQCWIFNISTTLQEKLLCHQKSGGDQNFHGGRNEGCIKEIVYLDMLKRFVSLIFNIEQFKYVAHEKLFCQQRGRGNKNCHGTRDQGCIRKKVYLDVLKQFVFQILNNEQFKWVTRNAFVSPEKWGN